MSYIKPTAPPVLDTGHPLYANVEDFWELGQDNEEMLSSTAITTTATTQADVDIGDCKEFDATADAITETMSFDGGGKTVLIVHKLSATYGNGGADVEFLSMTSAGHILDINLRNGIQYSTTFRGAYGSTVIHNSNSLSNQGELDALRCVAITLSETGGIKYAIDGALDNSTTSTTNAYSAAKNIDLMSAIGSGTAYARVGAIVLFDKVLSDSELVSITGSPWGLLGEAPPRAITGMDGDNTVQAGQTSVAISTTGLDTAPTTQTVTLGGEVLTVVDWNSGQPVVDVPLHINLLWGASHQLAVTDDTGTVTLAGVTLSAPSGWEQVIFNGVAPDTSTTDSLYEEAVSDLSFTGATNDVYVWTTQTGLSHDVQTLPTIDPASTVTFDYKVWDSSLSTWTSVSEGTWTDGGEGGGGGGSIPAANRVSIGKIADALRIIGGYTHVQANELVVEWLVSEGITRSSIDPMLYAYLGGLGYAGTINDRMRQWRLDS